MSTPGSVRSGDSNAYGPPAAAQPRPPAPPGGATGAPGDVRRRRTRVFRWEGIVPFMLVLALLAAGWLLLGERMVRDAIVEAGTKALGTQLDIAELRIHPLRGAVELRGIALADPFDLNRNLFEIRAVRLRLEPAPLLEKRLVVTELAVTDVATGTRRATPATAVTGPGSAPRALAEVRRFAKQFDVPLLALTPIDTLKSLVLDPTRLKSVQAALAVGRQADSVQQAIETGYATLRIDDTLDSSRALVARLQTTNLRALGLDGARRAIDDTRRASARIDSARARVDALLAAARRGVDTLQAGVAAIDAARREDYAFARGLLKLPSFEGPDIGSALFGRVTIERFEQALYWTTLARRYAPPGLLPKESPGPKRLRRAGTTIHFAAARGYPRFWLRRADMNVVVSGGALAGTYAIAARDVTTDPAIVGRPTLFALRRTGGGGGLDSLRASGSIDHTGAGRAGSGDVRETVNVSAAGVRLPAFAVPGLPYTMDPGRGSSAMRIALDGDQISGRWEVRSANVMWKGDSTGATRLSPIASLVASVLTGVSRLELTADVGGTLGGPRLAVRSNLDRQLADRLRRVAGETLARAETRAREQVDRLVAEKSAPVKARIAAIRAEGERRIAEARTRLDDEKRKLDERLRALTGNMRLPKIPG